MSILDVKLIAGSSKDVINKIVIEWLELVDETYISARHKHTWKCKCGNLFTRDFDHIKRRENYNCGCIEYKKIEKRYKQEVEKTGEYEYIRSFRSGDMLPNGKIVKGGTYIELKHLYCGSVYIIRSDMFINKNVRCSKCCGSYEKSFAHYIEKELGEPLEKYWDFEKNILNPRSIHRNKTSKVWIKCQEKTYHGSYEVVCYAFTSGTRCPYCNTFASNKVHPRDSFAQHHVYNTDKDFLEKYWDYDKNIIDPYELSIMSDKKVWIKCNKCNESYYMYAKLFSKGCRCSKCINMKGESKIKRWLDINQIEYDTQKKFRGLVGVGNRRLSYDFYIPKLNMLIEFQGEQHDNFIEMFHNEYDNFEKQKEHDRRKREYAKNNNISLLEIWHYEIDNIESKLEKELMDLDTINSLMTIKC